LKLLYNFAANRSPQQVGNRVPFGQREGEDNMRKHWVGLLSMLGLAGSSMPAVSQVLKGSSAAAESKIKLQKSQVEKSAATQASQDKWKKGSSEVGSVQSNASQKQLQLKQETLRTQQTAQGEKNALTKAKDDAALTKASANKSGNSALTKAKSSKSALTKASSNRQALTKAKQSTGQQ
jgi:hypothetical protein